MQARPGPAYKPEDFRRGYSREQILAHVSECLELYGELDDQHGIDAAVAPSVFATIQTMVASVEPTEETLRKLQTKARLAGNGGDGLPLLGKR